MPTSFQGTQRYEMKYNGDSLRFSRLDPGSVENRYVWAGSELLHRYKIEGQPVIKQSYQQGNLPLMVQDTVLNQERFLHADALGSVCYLSSGESGLLTDSFYYEDFGKPPAPPGTPSMEVPFRFTGQQLDPSGLYYLRARYYDPELGRLLSRDPQAGFYYFPETFNPYIYALNQPVNLVDPSGEIPVETIWDIGNVIYDVITGDTRSLAWDTTACFIPYVPAGISKFPKSAALAGKGWKVGDSVDTLTCAGKYPSWPTVRRRFWKNEAAKPDALGRYGKESVERMKRGLAPQTINRESGRIESKHLHHREGRNIVSPHNPNNLEDLWRNEHWKKHKKKFW